MSNEIFIITINEDLDDTTTEIFIYKNIEACNFKLENTSWGNIDEDNIRVYHGILTNATFIPENFKGCTPYIVLKNPEGNRTSIFENECIFEKTTAETTIVVNRIQELLKNEELFTSPKASLRIASTIEDIKIFYGQRQPPILQISEENLDEEVIYRLSSLTVDFTSEKDSIMRERN
jgi:hypothetical protein